MIKTKGLYVSPLSLGLVSLIALTGTILFTPASYADNDTAVDDVTINVPIACTLSGVGMNTHNATVNSGTLASNIGTTTIKAVCNDTNGFAIYAIGYTDNTYGKNVLTSSANGSSSDIATGTGTSGNSQWAMKLATDGNATYPITIQNGFDSSSYHTVPDDFTLVAKRTAGTDMGTSATGSTLTSTYQAYISSSQPAGTYSGQVLYALVHPHTASAPPTPQTTASGKICYYANASDAVGTMGCQTVSTTATSAALLPSNFSRANYGFAGWSDAYDYRTNSNANFYGPQEVITFTAGQYTGSNDGLSLYAVWVPSAGSIQGWTGCSSLTKADQATNILTQSITALTDQRDNETYAVAKLADGKCWMIENLRLESTNSDNSTGALAQGYGGQFIGLASSEVFSTNTSSANNLYSTNGSNNTINVGTTHRMPRYDNSNVLNRASSPTTVGTRVCHGTGGSRECPWEPIVNYYSYGNYYTWAAAMANTTEMNNATTSEAANTSLCPNGWRLPYGNNTGNGASAGSFSYLDIQLGGTGAKAYDSTQARKWKSFPNNFVMSGISSVIAEGVGERGYEGNYWSSSANNQYLAYTLLLNGNVISPGTNTDYVYKRAGATIRCIVSNV